VKTLWAKAKAWYKDLDEDTRTLVWFVAVWCFILLAVVTFA
jgi:hypothetical protein